MEFDLDVPWKATARSALLTSLQSYIPARRMENCDMGGRCSCVTSLPVVIGPPDDVISLDTTAATDLCDNQERDSYSFFHSCQAVSCVITDFYPDNYKIRRRHHKRDAMHVFANLFATWLLHICISRLKISSFCRVNFVDFQTQK